MSDTADNIGSSVDKIKKLDESEQGTRKPPVKKKPKPKEKRGVGTDNSAGNFKALAAQLNAKIAAARKTGNNNLADKLAARKEALRKASGQ